MTAMAMEEARTVGPFDPSMAGYESRYAQAADIETHYIEAGEGNPLLLMHGGGPGADGYGNWYSCLPGFAARFRAIAPDMLGFGRTAKPDPAGFTYSQEARVDHLIAFIEALDLAPVSIMGNSMGGCTGLGVAMKRPELVHKLVLMGPAGIKSGVPAALTPLMEYDGTTQAMARVIEALTHSSYQADEALLSYRVQLSLDPATKAAQGAAMRWIKEQGGLHYPDEAIAAVKTPALVLGGKDDPIVTPKQVFRFLELLENSWGYVIPHCGHWVMMERPEEFVTVSSYFLSQ